MVPLELTNILNGRFVRTSCAIELKYVTLSGFIKGSPCILVPSCHLLCHDTEGRRDGVKIWLFKLNEVKLRKVIKTRRSLQYHLNVLSLNIGLLPYTKEDSKHKVFINS